MGFFPPMNWKTSLWHVMSVNMHTGCVGFFFKFKIHHSFLMKLLNFY